MMSPRHRIVVALDLSEYSEIVLDHALDQALQHKAPDLHFISVATANADVDTCKQRLAELVLPELDRLDGTDWRARLHVRTGDAPEEIANLASELRAHVIVIGRFGSHHPLRRISTFAARVIDLAPCPTLVVGLGGDAADEPAQCAECVAVRAESDGERWFCTKHTGDRCRLSAMVSPGSSWLGGLMW